MTKEKHQMIKRLMMSILHSQYNLMLLPTDSVKLTSPNIKAPLSDEHLAYSGSRDQ